jgi:hypothetical protein
VTLTRTADAGAFRSLGGVFGWSWSESQAGWFAVEASTIARPQLVEERGGGDEMQVLTRRKLGGEGNRTTLVSASRTPISQDLPEHGTQDGTWKAEPQPDLAVVVRAWSELPEHIKAIVLSLVRITDCTDRE